MEENRYKKGLTLLEVLTSVFIIALLSALTFGAYRQSNKQYALLRSANKLAQDIRRAQQMAMATKQCPLGTSCVGLMPQGYGIRLSSGNTNYLLYADVGGSQHQIELINLERGVVIEALTPPSPLTVNFNPPDPTTRINGDSSIIECAITLAVQNPLKTKVIRVNKAGLIWVE